MAFFVVRLLTLDTIAERTDQNGCIFFISHPKKMRLLGKGSYGQVVHEYWQNKEAAVKTFTKKESSKTDPRLELCILRCLDHPNIIQLLSANLLFDGTSYKIVFEYARNGPLLHYNGGNKEYHVSQLLKAIAYCHSMNIAHMDIKPDNILVFEDEHIKLCDFGFARIFGDNETLLTRHWGTPEYSSPEIANKHASYDAFRSDMWSVGVCIHVITTGNFLYKRARHTDKRFRQLLDWGLDVCGGYDRMYDHSRSEVHRHLINNTIRANPTERLSASAALEWISQHKINSVKRGI